MDVIVWILIFTVAGSVLSVAAAGGFLLLPEHTRAALLPALVSLAIGSLLGAAFLALLPHALETPGMEPHTVGGAVLAGLLLFFLLEKFVLWRHSHGDHEPAPDLPGSVHSHGSAAGHLILLGDGIHNFVDGVLIASAFLTDVRLGVVTSIAVIAHEIPQEVSDFAILLYSGFSRARAFVYNIIAGLTTVLGGVLAYYSLAWAEGAVPYVLAIAAASFIYIAVADLIPGLNRRVHVRAILQQALLILAGIGIIVLAEQTLH